MLRIISPNLPLSATFGRNKAPLCRIYNGANKNLAPIAHINIYARYGVSQGFKTFQVELPPPLFVGNYYQINLGYKIQNIFGGTNIKLISRPSYLQPNIFWFKDSFFNVVVDETRDKEALSLRNCALTSCPVPSSDGRYILDIGQWGDFTATNALVQGLTFTVAKNVAAPQPYEFTQTTNQVCLFGTVQSALKVGAEITLCGTQLVTLAQAKAKVCIFDLSFSGIHNVDKLDYLGISFSLAKDTLSPTVGSFLWDEQSKQAAIFLSCDRARGLSGTANTQANTVKTISQLNI